MIIAFLFITGLCLGSFVNALVWRLREQSKSPKKRVASNEELSIAKGRSMCPNCQETLKWYDLLPVLSWMSLQGKCRYCEKPISIQYPLVELATAGLFVSSYIFWPEPLIGLENYIFGLWLIVLTGLMALLVYDAHWKLLPNKIMFPLIVLGLVMALLRISSSAKPLEAIISTGLAVLIGGGIFYLLYQSSQGRWIGGGDVKLGWLLGLIVATPAGSFMVIFLAATLGTLIALPGLLTKRLKATSEIPFGPFLIIAAVIVLLFGVKLLNWYERILIPA